MKPIPEIRPVLKILPTRTDYFLESITFLCLLATWILPAILFFQLPEIIPTHFSLSGKVDDWGSKGSIFIIPAISLVILIAISILNKYPHKFNFTEKVTDENAFQLYTKGCRIIRITKVIVAIVFLLIEWMICYSAISSSLPDWILPVIISIPVVLPVLMAFMLTRKPTSGKPG